MPRKPMRTFVVPVTIAEDHRVTVRARDADEAREKVSRGRYVRLGRPLPGSRGFLLVGRAEEEPRA